MSELTPHSSEIQRTAMSEVELMALGELCLPENVGVDFQAVAQEHADLLEHPNTASTPSMFTEGEIPTTEGFGYRQVGVEAIHDLAESGIVRNGATAQGQAHHRWGHRVFWHRGQDGRAVNTGGRFVLEAPMDAVTDGWVTADKVSAIYAKTPDGTTKNILTQG